MPPKSAPAVVVVDSPSHIETLKTAVRAALTSPRLAHLDAVSNGRLEEHLHTVCTQVAGRGPSIEIETGAAVIQLMQRCGLRAPDAAKEVKAEAAAA